MDVDHEEIVASSSASGTSLQFLLVEERCIWEETTDLPQVNWQTFSHNLSFIMSDGQIVAIALRRFDTSQPWGFKMQGGADVGCPIHVAQVQPKSISGKSGLQNGDLILRIGQTDMQNSTHEQARNEIIRAGNDVDLVVQRGGVAVKPASQPEPEEEREKFQDVQPKTYQVLQKELPQAQATGARPASIFDKRRQERSAYTKTDQSGYTKAYGQPK